MKKHLIGLFAGLAFTGSIAHSGERWEVKTPDGVSIVGNYEGVTNCTRSVVLLHSLGRTHKDWAAFQTALKKAGICSVALDMRGHGESKKHAGKPDLDFNNFLGRDWETIANNDVRAILTTMKKFHKKGPAPAIIGSSLGANLALVSSTRHRISGVGLLSPGMDYKGVRPFAVIRDVKVPLFLSASKNDPKSYSATQEIQKAYPGRKTYLYFNTAGHGTKMLANKSLAPALIKWLKTLK